MTHTYTPPLAGVFSSPLNEIRYLSEDTVETAQSLSDEEIAYELIYWLTPRATAAAALDRRAGKYELLASSKGATLKVGDLSIGTRDYAMSAASLRALADRIRNGGQSGDTPTFTIALPPTSAGKSVFRLGINDLRGTH